MKMGVPCIITNSGTTQKYLRNDIDAVLIPPRDEQALARESIRLLYDDALKNTLSKNGRCLTQLHFSTEYIVNTYDRMICDLCKTEKKI
jgi:glycosyltransferase involved in cell wall biosynthesis